MQNANDRSLWQRVRTRRRVVDLTEPEAAQLLRSTGRTLKESVSTDGDTLEIENRDAVSRNLLALIYYFEHNGPSEYVPFREMFYQMLRNIPFALPGYGSRLIRAAEYSPATDDERIESSTLMRLASALERNSANLAALRTDLDEEAWADLLNSIPAIDAAEGCVDHPVEVEEQLFRLRQLIGPPLPNFVVRYYLGFAVALAATVAGLVVTPWSGLGDRTSFRGLHQFILPLAMFAVGATTTCSVIAHGALRALNDETLATAKTLSKATNIILALSTFVLGVGLTIARQSTIWVITCFALYAMVLTSTLAADHLVNRIDARLKRIAASGTNNSTGHTATQ